MSPAGRAWRRKPLCHLGLGLGDAALVSIRGEAVDLFDRLSPYEFM